jgi:hypothetical protein
MSDDSRKWFVYADETGRRCVEIAEQVRAAVQQAV